MKQEDFDKLTADEVISRFIFLSSRAGVSNSGLVISASAENDILELKAFKNLVMLRMRAGDECLRRPFPWYELIVDGQSEFHPIHQAGRVYDCGHIFVSFGTRVLLSDGTTRPITPEEKSRIIELADEYSDSK